MSNNPGKKGKTTPWVKREREDRDRAFDEFKQLQHSAYREWREVRSRIGIKARAEADGLFPSLSEIGKSMKYADMAISTWEKENPKPMTWEESQALEADFAKHYVPIDRS